MGGWPATPAAAWALRSALLLRSSSAFRCSSASARWRRAFMIIWGVRMVERSAWVTGTGPPRAPPFAARPPGKSLICAFSSTRSGVNEYGTRIASSRTNRMADAVRREMRRAGWGSNRWASRPWVKERARGRVVDGDWGANLTERCCCWVGSTDLARSKLGVRRRVGVTLREELELREWLCCVRWNSSACNWRSCSFA